MTHEFLYSFTIITMAVALIFSFRKIKRLENHLHSLTMAYLDRLRELINKE